MLSGMPGGRSLLSLLAVGLAACVSMPGHAASSDVVSARHRTTHWDGTLSGAAPLGCAAPNLGCDRHAFAVDAPQGSWITVSVATAESVNLRVTTSDGRLVGNGGINFNPADGGGNADPTTTFQQVSNGRVDYVVMVGDVAATAATSGAYRGTVQLAGRAFDRGGDCGITTGLEHLRDEDNGGPTRTVRVRLVADPRDATVVHAAGKTITQIYARINVPVKVSYDFFRLPPAPATGFPYDPVRQRYGGVRPPGVDVVDVMTDEFAGGQAACIGGIAYPEKAFAVSNVHYTVQGTVPVDQVPAGMVAAHEIGHLLGAQHQQANCAEALPQEINAPAADGWIGPCTLMGPAALQDSETFSTLERDTIRAYARAYAGR